MYSTEITGRVHSLESFGAADGPGVRFVVFLQGCNMRCKFCHNPDTWADGGELWSANDLWKKIKRYKNYWGKSGGITVSGGEPLLQIELVTELFKLAKQENVHTAIDTAGQPYTENAEFIEKFSELMNYTDLVLLDLKVMDSTSHRKLTGVDNSNIIAMAKWLSKNNKAMWIRHVLVPTVTDTPEDLKAMAKFINSLNTVEKVEVLPYHTLGISKWESLGINYPLKGIKPPEQSEIDKAVQILNLT